MDSSRSIVAAMLRPPPGRAQLYLYRSPHLSLVRSTEKKFFCGTRRWP